MSTNRTIRSALLAGAVAVMSPMGVATAAPPLSGAIFTTTEDGSIVNENVRYQFKEDVYLDGGPGPNAPASAAGLPEGDYFFQVTDPSGKDLLSTDNISCRRVHVNAQGVIDEVFAGTNLEKQQGEWAEVACLHNFGIDIDHSELGAITVQLIPYDDTPNKGGVYKAWVTPVANYAGTLPECVGQNGQCNVNGENWQPGNVHGFIPAASKTDNYKVRKKGPPFEPPVITARKFHDKNFNGVQEEGDEDVTGWRIDVTDPTNVTNIEFTPATVVADEGVHTFVEETPAGTEQTVSTLDGVNVSIFPTAIPTVLVTVAGTSGETHEVVYGNVGIGSLTACKIFDRNANGQADEGEPGVPGWRVDLEGTTADGMAFGPVQQTTGADGCTTFADLLPGAYTVTEIIPPGGVWQSTGDESASVDIESSLSGSDISGTVASASFTNVCEITVAFGTKGYWHNKNGLTELTDEAIAFANGLDPYDSPTSYFDDGDEPFDGLFSDGVTQVDAAFNNDDLSQGVAAEAGTPRAEVSQFLTDKNAGGDPREQLAQQLLAFVFNVWHRLGGTDAAIMVDGQWVIAGDLIADAIAVWQSGTAAEQNAMQTLLNGLNESDTVATIPAEPCEVSYN